MKKKLSAIGLDTRTSEELAEKLNNLLANYSVFYQNVRGYHWNIKGEKFFELHAKFEELYNDLLIKMDELAERILTLGYAPDHKFTSYLKTSQIKESTQSTDGLKGVADILESFKVLIVLQREIASLSAEIDDEGTNAIMSDYIREQEKMVWMYSAFLNNK
jgi:starvation-inducible DNA-binding protein